MTIKIETLKLHDGKTMRFVKKGFAIGKKAFIKEGYTQSPNKRFMQKGNTIVHYNKIMKVWIVEKA